MLNLLFFLIGFIAIVLQTLLLREMFVVFQGNEISLGLVLSHWLFGSALGSYTAGKASIKKIISTKNALIIAFIANSFLSLISLALVRNIRSILNIFPGEGISLGIIAVSSFLIFLPLSFLIGAQFSLGTLLAEEQGSESPAKKMYMMESFGYMAGGIIFTYLFLPAMNSYTIIIFLVILCLRFSAWLFFENLFSSFLNLAALISLIFMPSISNKLEHFTLSNTFKGFEIKEIKNSPYAQYIVSNRNNELYFFSNGIPLLNFPNPDTAKIEEFGYIPMLFHSNPQKILLIGGAEQYLQPLLNRNIKELDYIELDPALIELIKKYSPEKINDNRLKIYFADGRIFLEESYKNYDVILIALHYPLNLSLNRYFTAEFFSLIQQKLSPGGILSLSVPGSTIYLNPALTNLNTIIKNTLSTSFKYIEIIPGDDNIFIASDEPLPKKTELIKRLSELKLKTSFISENYIDYKMNADKIDWLKNKIQNQKQPAVNYDFYPKGMLASLLYWQSIFAPKIIYIYNLFINYLFVLWLLPLLWLIFGKLSYPGIAFSSGFAGMGLQMLCIWGIQIFNGSIYHWIGILTACFMAGITAGSHFIRKTNYNKKILAVTEIIFCAWIVCFLAAVLFQFISWPVFLIFSAGAGALLGLQFPMLVSFQSIKNNSKESQEGGHIYAADLLGGWLAALIGGTLIIPAWGFEKTIIFILLLKLSTCRHSCQNI